MDCTGIKREWELLSKMATQKMTMNRDEMIQTWIELNSIKQAPI